MIRTPTLFEGFAATSIFAAFSIALCLFDECILILMVFSRHLIYQKYITEASSN